jgi:ClpP class serine protease
LPTIANGITYKRFNNKHTRKEMDFRLIKEIYGKAWCTDAISLYQHKQLLEASRQFVHSGEKMNVFSVIAAAKKTDGKGKQQATENIGVYRLDSVITKHGGMSHNGTYEIAAQMLANDRDETFAGHIIHFESGGGSVDAIAWITDAMSQCTKPIIGYIEDYCCSAALYIASYCHFVFSAKTSAIVGSVGVMMEFEGYKANSESSDGTRHIRAYASQSTDKNAPYEIALNEMNIELLQKEILNPLADKFMADMKANRPNCKDEHLHGGTFTADKVVGVYLDEIGDFNSAIAKVFELSKINANIATKSANSKTNKMDINELQSAHAETFAQAAAIGAQKAGIDAVKAFKDHAPKTTMSYLLDGKGADAAFFASAIEEIKATTWVDNAAAGSAAIVTPNASEKTEFTAADEKAAADAYVRRINAKNQ